MRHHLSKGLFFISLSLLLLIVSGCGEQQAAARNNTGPATHQTATSVPTLAPTPTPVPVPTPTPTPSVAEPMHLTIPAIGVDAPVEQVGLAADGSLETPAQNPWKGVGWYQAGPKPGEKGSAVIDGHLDDYSAVPAVFWNLKKLQPGDDVVVIDAQGQTIHFKVDHVASYPPDQAPLQQIFGKADGTYLNLITCGGYWIPSKQQLSERFVVYTYKV